MELYSEKGPSSKRLLTEGKLDQDKYKGYEAFFHIKNVKYDKYASLNITAAFLDKSTLFCNVCIILGSCRFVCKKNCTSIIFERFKNAS